MNIEYCTQKFQFHKGAIRTGSRVLIVDLDAHFNSIKVRLEHDKLSDMPSAIANFNSIKVRLEQKFEDTQSLPNKLISIP